MRYERHLFFAGALTFLLGLLTGLLVPWMANPRMALTSHLEGLFNGIFLLVLGLLWSRLRLSETTRGVVFWLALYGALANWAATFLAALWGAGVSMPIAAQGSRGTTLQEGVIDFLLYSLTAAMLAVGVLVLWGLRPTLPLPREAATSAGQPATGEG